VKPKKGYHRHHKVPIHAGGTDDESNLEYLTIEEHIVAHLDLYERYGREADRDAANFLQACLNKEWNQEKYEYFIRSCKRGGKAAHLVKLANGFYAKLGAHNSQILRGRVRPDLAAAKKAEWAEKPLKWFTDGRNNRRLLDCPEGWSPGRTPHLRKDARPRTVEKFRVWRDKMPLED